MAQRRLEAALSAHSDCAIAAPQLLNADGSVQASVRRSPTLWTGMFGRHSLLTRLFPRSPLARRELPAADLAAAAEDHVIDWVMGAAMLIRRDAFDVVGGFDERYFLYWEDADRCRRLRDRGWTTRYVPSALVTNAGGVSAKTSHAFATRAFPRSAYLYYSTHVVRSPLHRFAGWRRPRWPRGRGGDARRRIALIQICSATDHTDEHRFIQNPWKARSSRVRVPRFARWEVA